MYRSEPEKIEIMHKRRAGRPSVREAELKHEALLEAALEEFSRHGFHGGSVRAISERAGVSTRTLYNRYPDKVTLFAACLEMSAIRHHFPIEESQRTLREQLMQFAMHTQEKMNHDRQIRLARIMFRECISFPELVAVSRHQYERHQLEPVQMILMEHGFEADRAMELGAAYISMLFRKWENRVIHDTPAMTRAEMKEHAETVTSLFLNGARPA